MPYARDRVKDSTTTTGTGNVTLSGTAPTGYQTFANAYNVGDVFPYCIAGGSEWEVGLGYLSASTTLVRDTVENGSSGIATAVNFSAGTKDVFVTLNSHWQMDANSGALLARIKSQGWA